MSPIKVIEASGVLMWLPSTGENFSGQKLPVSSQNVHENTHRVPQWCSIPKAGPFWVRRIAILSVDPLIFKQPPIR
jgi:hypothetical protein